LSTKKITFSNLIRAAVLNYIIALSLELHQEK
jgi:hypothetical protein